jgi:hypothetical protein
MDKEAGKKVVTELVAGIIIAVVAGHLLFTMPDGAAHYGGWSDPTGAISIGPVTMFSESSTDAQ